MCRELFDLEVTMHVFRLMRSGNYRSADALVQSMKEDFPEVPEDRLMQIMNKLCRKLMEND